MPHFVPAAPLPHRRAYFQMSGLGVVAKRCCGSPVRTAWDGSVQLFYDSEGLCEPDPALCQPAPPAKTWEDYLKDPWVLGGGVAGLVMLMTVLSPGRGK